jgi:glutamate carboxypeptidase
LERLVRVNSHTPNREGIAANAKIIEDTFAPLGFKATRVPSRNTQWGEHLFLHRPGTTTRNIMLVSHLDTVFPVEEEQRNQFHWQREGDRIYGPGTVDIKGGTAMMFLMLKILSELAPEELEQLTWWCAWNASEEVLSEHFGEVCRERFNRDTLAALVFEAGHHREGEDLLVVGRKGRATYQVTVEGRGAHAGSDHPFGANAIVQAGRTLDQVGSLTDYARELTFNVGTIRGGTGYNRVPHQVVADIEMRAFSKEIYEQGKKAILGLSGPGTVKSPQDGFACQVEVVVKEESVPWPENPGTRGLYEHWKRIGDGLGMRIGSERRGGLSDANLIWDAVPTLDGLGPAGGNSHCSERSEDGTKVPEYVEVSSFVPKAVWHVQSILGLAAGRKPGE